MKDIILKLVFLTLGAFLAAFSLEEFLVPNNIIDGGIVGISMMTSYVTKFNLGIILAILNLPFIILALNEFGKRFVIGAFYSVIALSLFVNLISSHLKPVTHDLLLASFFGGATLYKLEASISSV